MMAKKLNLDLSNPEDNYEILNYTYNTTDPKNRTIKLLKLLLSNSKNQLPNIIFDTVDLVIKGIGNHVKLMTDLINLAKASGYDTTLVYVKTDINIALQRNMNRERKLDNDLVIKYHNSVNKSFDILFPLFDNVWLVDNNDNLDLNYRLNITHKLK
jgi:tRNA uridine 5-carbamoylmethylation protein Kti12